MSSLTRLICLANSWKRGERCIAGITTLKGKWVRPVSDLPDGQIPKEMRRIDGLEPTLLDILAIPLATTGPDYNFESENLSVLPGKWRKVGKVPPEYLLKYYHDQEYILHNNQRYVTVSFMKSLPKEKRQTLQLVKAVALLVNPIGKRFEMAEKWEGTIVTKKGQRLNTTITDPVFVRRLELGYRPENTCLVTVSLSMPWRPRDWEGDDPCWKLIAGVIELPRKENDVDELPF
ncbi:MAG: hypothetical protein F6K10_12805 [Moorea sp. SIO2B7]|nr:hypothetical protein [Moorena sp. SIO2B7]